MVSNVDKPGIHVKSYTTSRKKEWDFLSNLETLPTVSTLSLVSLTLKSEQGSQFDITLSK